MNTANPHIIEADELAARLGEPQLRIVDASWYLPAQKRDGRAEYLAARVPGAVYFDIDEIADKSSGLPHMLPSPEAFAEAVGALGISEHDDIVVYDGPGIFSAARVWWNFRVMGAKNVRLLNGGFDRWRAAGLPIEAGEPPARSPANFVPHLDASKVAGIADIRANLKSGHSLLVDARPFARFAGQADEPRPGLRSGHVPGAKSLPADQLVKDGKLRPVAELKQIFDSLSLDAHRHAITSCGSGVTAAIISLALVSAGHENHALYDGSWAEWGQADNAPVAQWPDNAKS